MDELDQLLERVRREAHGKLPLAVYRRLYDSAQVCGGGAIVEVGTSQGAATIALALGAQASGRPFRIFTCDPFLLGSRPLGVSADAKAQVARDGFEKFGVGACIEMVVGNVERLLDSHDIAQVGLVLIDADGRIDRDLALLLDRLVTDCAIIVDDIDERTYLHPRGTGFQVDQKHRLTSLLLKSFIGAGLLVPEVESGQTGWYRKGAAVFSPRDVQELALGCYRQLVYTEVGLRELSLKYRLHQFLSARFPAAIALNRRLRGR